MSSTIPVRESKDLYFLRMAFLVGERATCIRRQVGCVLVDFHYHVIGTGYNGPPSGAVHCIDLPCNGARHPSGVGLDKCEAVHAEQNALLQCKGAQSIWAAYITCQPCWTCLKLFMNTSCKRLVIGAPYSHETIRAMKERWSLSADNRVLVDYQNNLDVRELIEKAQSDTNRYRQLRGLPLR